MASAHRATAPDAVTGERFARKFISLFALAKQQGRHFLAVKKELDAAGIEPALDPKKVGATFYLREDLNQPSFR